MDNRDMYYNTYGYTQGNYPMMPNFMPFNFNMNPNEANKNYMPYDPINDINNRINKIEKQMKRLEQRINRLETPYANNNYNEPDNSMYML